MPDKIEHRSNVVCPRCKHVIAVGHNNAKHYVLALCVTALILLAVACSFSFISFASNGQARTINLLQTFTELYAQGYIFVSLLVFLFILLLPLLYLLSLSYIILSTRYRLGFLPVIGLGKVISHILPWSMAEVFLIGVLVALIKIISMADIFLQASFWAYVLFAPLFTHIVFIVDNHRLWRWVDDAK
ncbi:paraquat-inducible protein A [Glaciecola sp. MH2013]|uniref:paraquat-inducible protein A n=1 Tax=Glaciecola sp. MH2013 TaxID=2785524 RepID=UPI00189D9CFB|nr:paraquat-inducible protein A [Glaciecola sp. MH2013]MBF7073907.1 paraquat-inducible protein A [Glaciecola sp. MH2013]